MSNDTATLEQRLTALESRSQIERLIYSYGHNLDFGDLDAYADMFIDEATLEIQGYFINVAGMEAPFPYEAEGLASGGIRTSRGIAFVGRSAIRGFVSQRKPSRRSLHVSSQPLIELTSADTARAFTYMRVYSQEYSKLPEIRVIGRYVDTFLRTNAGWKFKTRVCEI
jgi:hypothetical protein